MPRFEGFGDRFGGGQPRMDLERESRIRRRLNLLMDGTGGALSETPDVMLRLASDLTLSDDAMLRGATAALSQTQLTRMAEDLANSEKEYQYSYWQTLPVAMQQELLRVGYKPVTEEEAYPSKGGSWFDWEIPFTSVIHRAASWIDPTGTISGSGNIEFAGTKGLIGQIGLSPILLGPRLIQEGVGLALEGFETLERNWNHLYRFAETAAEAYGPVFSGSREVNAVGLGTLWDRTSDGEEFVQDDNIVRASEILGRVSDPMAAYWTDRPATNDPFSAAGKLWLARKTVGGHTPAEIAEEFGFVRGTDEYNTFVVQMYQLQGDESFQKALAELEQGKISFGRGVARSLGLYDNPNNAWGLGRLGQTKIWTPLGTQTLGSVVSGAGDFAWVIWADPTLVGSKVSVLRRSAKLFKVDDIKDLQLAYNVKTAMVTGASEILDPRTGRMISTSSRQFSRLAAKVERTDLLVDEIASKIDEVKRLRAAGDEVAANRVWGRFVMANPRMANVVTGLWKYLDSDDAARGLLDGFEWGGIRLDQDLSFSMESALSDTRAKVWRYMLVDKGRTAVATTAWGGMDAKVLALPQMTRVEKHLMQVRDWAWNTAFNVRHADDTKETIDSINELLDQIAPLMDKARQGDEVAKAQVVEILKADFDKRQELLKGLTGFRSDFASFWRAFLRHIPRQNVANVTGMSGDEFGRIASQLFLAKVPQHLVNEYVGAWHLGTDAERALLTMHLIGDILIRSGALIGGRHSDKAWQIFEQHVNRIYHAYTHIPGGDAFSYRGLHAKAGLLPTEFDYRIAMPNFRQLAEVSREMGTLRRIGLHPTAAMMDAKMRRFWVPLQLMRIGFIPRAAGEELIHFLLKEGPKPYLAAIAARRASGYTYWNRLEKLGDKASLILDDGRAVVKLSDATRQSAILAPLTGFTRFLREFARITGADLLNETEARLLTRDPMFRHLPAETRAQLIRQNLPKTVQNLSTFKRGIVTLDDWAFLLSNRTAMVLNRITPSAQWVGAKLVGEKAFAHMVAAAKEMMTDPLVAGAHARLLGQSYSRYAQLSNAEGAMQIIPTWQDGSLVWVPTRLDYSHYQMVKRPDPEDAANLTQEAAEFDKMNYLPQLARDWEEIASSPMGAVALEAYGGYVGPDRLRELSEALDRAGVPDPIIESLRGEVAKAAEDVAEAEELLKKDVTTHGWEILPGVGPAKARAIEEFLANNQSAIGHIKIHGTFHSLTEVPGITPQMVERWFDEGFGWYEGRPLQRALENQAERQAKLDEALARGRNPAAWLTEYTNMIHAQQTGQVAGRLDAAYEAIKKGDYDKARAIIETMVPETTEVAHIQAVLLAALESPEKRKDLLAILTSPNLRHRLTTDLDAARDAARLKMLEKLYPEWKFRRRLDGGLERTPNPQVTAEEIEEARLLRERTIHLAESGGSYIAQPLPENVERLYFPVVQPSKAGLLRTMFLESDDQVGLFMRLINHVAGEDPELAREMLLQVGVGEVLEEGNIPLLERSMRAVIDTLTVGHEMGHAAIPLTIFGYSGNEAWAMAEFITRGIDDFIIQEARRLGLEVPTAPSLNQLMGYLDVPKNPEDWDSLAVLFEPMVVTNDSGNIVEMAGFDHTIAGDIVPISKHEFQIVEDTTYRTRERGEPIEEFVERVGETTAWRGTPEDLEAKIQEALASGKISSKEADRLRYVMGNTFYHGSVRHIPEITPYAKEDTLDGTAIWDYVGPGFYTTPDPHYAEHYAMGREHPVRGESEIVVIQWLPDELPGVIDFFAPWDEAMGNRREAILEALIDHLRASRHGNLADVPVRVESLDQIDMTLGQYTELLSIVSRKLHEATGRGSFNEMIDFSFDSVDAAYEYVLAKYRGFQRDTEDSINPVAETRRIFDEALAEVGLSNTQSTLAEWLTKLFDPEDLEVVLSHGEHPYARMLDLHRAVIRKVEEVATELGVDEESLRQYVGYLFRQAMEDSGLDVIVHAPFGSHPADTYDHVIWITPQKITLVDRSPRERVNEVRVFLNTRDPDYHKIKSGLASTDEFAEDDDVFGDDWAFFHGTTVNNVYATGGVHPLTAAERLVDNALDRIEDLVTAKNRPMESDDAFNNIIDSLINNGQPDRVYNELGFNPIQAFTDVDLDRLPTHLYTPRKIHQGDLSWNNIVRSVFDGMISPGIDAIFRSHFYLYAYSQARLQTMFIKENGLRAHLARSRQETGGRIPPAENLMHKDVIEDIVGVAWRQAEMSDDVINTADPRVLFARALQQNVTNLDGSLNQAAAEKMARDAEGAFRVMMKKIYPNENQVPEKLFERMGVDGWLAVKKDMTERAAIHRDWAEAATLRAYELVVPFIDDHNIRSQFQEYVGTIMPFWFAEEQFLKRWARGLYINPAMLRRGQITMNGLRHMGVIREDEEGNEFFVYPGSALAFEAIAPVASYVFGEPFGTVVQGGLSTRTSYMFPGMSGESLGQFQWGPMVALPTQWLGDTFPEFNSFRDALLGDVGTMRAGVIDHIIPNPLRNLYRAITRDGFDSAQLASAQFQALQIMAANDQLPPEGASDQEMADFLGEVQDITRLVLAGRALSSFVTGATATPINWEEMDIHQDFRELMESGIPFEDVISTFLQMHPGANAYTVFQTTTPSGAPIPATEDAHIWMIENEGFIQSFGTLSPWFLPTGDPAEDWGPKERRARAHAMATQLRVQKSPRELLDAMYLAEASEDYFDQVDAYETEILALQLNGRFDEAAQKQEELAIRKEGYLRMHPILRRELTSPEGRMRRERIVEEARMMLATVEIRGNRVVDYGVIPDTPHREGLVLMLQALVNYHDEYRALRGIQAGAATERREQLALDLWETTREIAAEYPQLMMFWTSNIRPIVSDIEAEMELLGGV